MKLKKESVRMLRGPVLVALLAASIGIGMAQTEPAADVWSVKVRYTSDAQLRQLTKLLDHPNVDQRSFTVTAEVSGSELKALQDMGMTVDIDDAETRRIQEWLKARTSDIASGAITRSDREQPSSVANGVHSCYRTVEQVYTSFDQLKAKYPKFVEIKDLGKSWMGTQIKPTFTVNGQPDNSFSNYRQLLAKFLPAAFLQRFDLTRLPDQPNNVKAIVVGNFAIQNEKTPRMVWTGGIHAREYAPQEVGVKFIEWLLDNYGKDANATMMLNMNQYHLIIHNPDGRKLAEQDISARQRKNTNYLSAACTTSTNVQVTTPSTTASLGYTTSTISVTNTIASGVDLNRNYPFGWGTGGNGGSDGNSCGETFRGVGPASEPETRQILNYVRGTTFVGTDKSWTVDGTKVTSTTTLTATPAKTCSWVGGVLPDGRPKDERYCNPENRNPDPAKTDVNGEQPLDWATAADENYGGGAFIDLHSNARAVLWPWGVERTENGNNTHTPNNKGMAVIAQRLAYHNNYSSQQLLSYNTEGTTKDAFYGYLGAPSYTVEMGRSFYEDCGVFARETFPENFNGFHYLSRVLHRVYKMPFGPDTVDVKVAAGASVVAGTKVSVMATVDDNRYRYSNAGQGDIKPPPYPVVYNIKSANAYIDKLPWEEGAQAIPLALSTSDSARSDFPQATKLASALIDTAGLAPGRHMVYVQGVNADDKAGAVAAGFLDVAVTPGGEVPNVPTAEAPVASSSSGGSFGAADLAALIAGCLAMLMLRRRKPQ
ncbi:MAG: hypothetical protein EOO28_32045 [Comamonadaceae bacterium]|nr:MAG: hypothetical protein EOO28_32045 [Comamonadaceae bacterium]